MTKIEELCINAIRVLSADMIQKAKSGHPGLPLGAAPMAYELWSKHMKHNPQNPKWVNRDRFILSAGHGSAMLYSLLHFFGYGLTMDDIKNFRQLGSLTPGHPEYGAIAGVEATTGPLGAGLGMAVGMAMAEAHLAAIFNKPDYPIIDHYTYALAGDGCMMEGISSEALSLAGTFGLNKLIILYDSNNITIEGNTDLTFTENVGKRVEAFGFQVLTVENGNDLDEIGKAIESAKSDVTRPSFIIIKTEIGYGCPAKQGKASSHGEPLGEENVKELKQTLGWHTVDEAFSIPDEVYYHYEDIANRLSMAEYDWNKMRTDYSAEYPEMKTLWDKYNTTVDSAAFEDIFFKSDKAEATRASSGKILNRLKDLMPNLIGGSADLGPSNKTVMADTAFFSNDDYSGRNIHFGVREMAMAAVINGIYLHGGLRPYAATFFVFSDYLKPMVRLSAIMRLPVIYIFTHDSIGVGEDGPTHEPIEQLAMFRSMPNVKVFRPADSIETAAAWYTAVTSTDAPTILVLTRQNVPQLAGTSKEALKGAYVVSEAKKADFDGILIATGSEVSIAIEAQSVLAEEGIDVRVVSMPCTELFERQSDEYKEQVLPRKVKARVAIEAAANYGWGSYVGLDGATVTMPSFGASAPSDVLFQRFGFTKENVASKMKNLLATEC